MQRRRLITATAAVAVGVSGWAALLHAQALSGDPDQNRKAGVAAGKEVNGAVGINGDQAGTGTNVTNGGATAQAGSSPQSQVPMADADGIRRTISQVTEAVVRPGSMGQLSQFVAGEDANRLRDLSQKNSILDVQIQRFQENWKQKYKQDFAVKDQQLVLNDRSVRIIPGAVAISGNAGGNATAGAEGASGTAAAGASGSGAATGTGATGTGATGTASAGTGATAGDNAGAGATGTAGATSGNQNPTAPGVPSANPTAADSVNPGPNPTAPGVASANPTAADTVNPRANPTAPETASPNPTAANAAVPNPNPTAPNTGSPNIVPPAEATPASARQGAGTGAGVGTAGATGTGASAVTGTGTPAGTGTGAANNNVATVIIPASHNMPEASAILTREAGANATGAAGASAETWKLDLPDSVDARQLQQNLARQLRSLNEAQTTWPAQANDAYNMVTHAVVLALSQPGQYPAETHPRPANTGANQQQTGQQPAQRSNVGGGTGSTGAATGVGGPGTGTTGAGSTGSRSTGAGPSENNTTGAGSTGSGGQNP
jgi:hypothetical protein